MLLFCVQPSCDGRARSQREHGTTTGGYLCKEDEKSKVQCKQVHLRPLNAATASAPRATAHEAYER